MGLRGVKQNDGSSLQRDAMASMREMQIKPLVFAEKQIAESFASILRAVMVVPGTTTRHQRNVTAGVRMRQTKYLHPVQNTV